MPLLLTLLVLITLACAREETGTGRERSEQTLDASCSASAVSGLVESFGARLERVSLLAPDSVLRGEIQAAYGSLTTSELLARWLADPRSAPGRSTSSPWPDRIEVDSVAAAGGAACRVTGDVVYVSSAGAAAARQRVSVLVRAVEGWKIDAYQELTSDSSLADIGVARADSAAAVIGAYYAAIAERRFRAAYALWSDAGAASGQSFEEFERGFAQTAEVRADVQTPGPVEGAAGSQYVRVPVRISARTRGGDAQRFEGTFTLRRSLVEGATPAQRSWRIESADVRALP